MVGLGVIVVTVQWEGEDSCKISSAMPTAEIRASAFIAVVHTRTNCHDDETYLACLLECVIAGEATPSKLHRPKISKALEHSNQRITKACLGMPL